MTLTRRINGERLSILGWGRAILMQLAHPLVAAGVAEHSTFRDSPVARVSRLHATIRAMLDLTFGAPDAVSQAAARINAVHDRVHGTLKDAAGPYPAGTPYTATDPQLLRWVDATLRDSLPLAYRRFVGPLSEDERETYCREGAALAPLLRIPDGVLSETCAELDAYVGGMLAGDRLVVTPVSRELAREVAEPGGAWAVWPAGRVHRLATVGLLPPALRAAYGFAWTESDARALDRWSARIRAVRRRLPDAMARWD